MISVADLVKDSKLPGNYFAPDAYVQGDYELGLMENRKGSRLLALPDTLLQAIYAGLEAEIGQAGGVVLFNCGRWWGKNFYRRFNEEVNEYYGKPLTQMEMVEFLECLKQCWKTHGWGVLDLDFNYYQQGFLVAQVKNSPFAATAPEGKKPVCFAEAGILSAFFSQLTGKDLHCIQTACESMGAECNYFVMGVSDRLKAAEAWLEEGQDHSTIMERLSHKT
ncbi:MAG: 4-vinyl reductase [Gomphosphaeria aponina SAG 52.96 = DSM 107014]|uniref:4-vinyl reductase n=1 Tax=Gomphosphaeria aponina SAG 52.96 = DSM 107014 TaxID=1521640 RepID=A0A941GV38_9CHRO|nr:4-vinyl reductase [Gomphosphaeria aponina SAG 52.96 = DSM 107014]